jgi:hypothetical protein
MTASEMTASPMKSSHLKDSHLKSISSRLLIAALAVLLGSAIARSQTHRQCMATNSAWVPKAT